MRRSVTLFAVLLLLYMKSEAQQDDLARIDSVTYTQYYYEQWRPLLDSADKAIGNRQDFYWLYLRAAYAARQLNKPYREYYYLSKVHRQYPADLFVTDRLYSNTFTTGSYLQFLQLNTQLRQDSAWRPYYPKPARVYMVNVESGCKFSSDNNLYKPLYYGLAGIGFRIKHVALYSSVGYLQQKMYYGNLEQYQLYVSAGFSTRNNWLITPVFHALKYKIGNASPFLSTPYLTGQPVAAGIQVSKLYRNFAYSAGVYYSNLGKEEQLQVQPGITWYPFSNNKLYLAAYGNYLAEKEQLCVSGIMGYAPINALSISVAYLSAQARYYTEQNGYIVNNSFDITKDRYIASINWKVHPLLHLYGVYQYETKTENYYDLPYAYQTGVIGIRKLF
jgi:hypothetical protein